MHIKTMKLIFFVLRLSIQWPYLKQKDMDGKIFEKQMW